MSDFGRKSCICCLLLGIDVERARNAEEWMMLEDAEKLLEAGETMSEATGGATALHVACAKGYLHVIK